MLLFRDAANVRLMTADHFNRRDVIIGTYSLEGFYYRAPDRSKDSPSSWQEDPEGSLRTQPSPCCYITGHTSAL